MQQWDGPGMRMSLTQVSAQIASLRPSGAKPALYLPHFLCAIDLQQVMLSEQTLQGGNEAVDMG